MSYVNPKRIETEKAFDALIKGGNQLVGTVAKTYDDVATNIEKQKKTQKALQEKENQEMQQMYDVANKFSSTGSSQLDENLVGYWNNNVDEYFRIKNQMQKGTIGKQEGNLALTRLKGEAKQFQDEAAYFATYLKDFNEAKKIPTGQVGSISSTSSQETQQVLQTMSEGGNVQIVNRGGNRYYFIPDTVDENGEVVKKGAMINASEFRAQSAAGTAPFETIEGIGDFQQNIWNSLNTDVAGADNIQINTTQEGDYTYETRSFQDRDKALETLRTSPTLDPLLNDTKLMTTYFQDVVPDEGENSLASFYDSDAGKGLRDAGITKNQFVNSRWGEMVGDPNDEKNAALLQGQNDAMRSWLANDTMNKFEPSLNTIDNGSYARKYKTPDPPKPEAPKDPLTGFTASVRTEIRNGEGRFNTATTTIDDFYTSNPDPSADQIVQLLNNAPYSINKTNQEFWIGGGYDENGEDVDGNRPGEAGKIYSTNGPAGGYSKDYFNKNNLSNMYLGQVFENQETVEHFNRQKPAKPAWDAATQQKWDAAQSGDIIIAPDGKKYKKP